MSREPTPHERCLIDREIDRTAEVTVDTQGRVSVSIVLPHGLRLGYSASEIVAAVTPEVYDSAVERWIENRVRRVSI